MKEFVEYLPFILPVMVIEFILLVTALVHVLKHPNYKFGNRAVWVLIVVFIQVFGPILYFVFGRGEE